MLQRVAVQTDMKDLYYVCNTQCVAECCSMLQRVAVQTDMKDYLVPCMQHTVCCRVFQCVAACCSVKDYLVSRHLQIMMYLVQISHGGNHVALRNKCDIEMSVT